MKRVFYAALPALTQFDNHKIRRWVEFDVLQRRRATDFEAPKLWKGGPVVTDKKGIWLDLLFSSYSTGYHARFLVVVTATGEDKIRKGGGAPNLCKTSRSYTGCEIRQCHWHHINFHFFRNLEMCAYPHGNFDFEALQLWKGRSGNDFAFWSAKKEKKWT